MDVVELSLFAHRISAACEEMGALLRHTAFSPNIRDRLDFSCAVFDAGGGLVGQAAHIPVHLGSMAFAMRDVVGAFDWQPGDMLVLNDPFLGGTHLPDVTVIAPVYRWGRLCGYVANRAHHADIGCTTPGSMPLSTRLEDEGTLIPPTRLVCADQIDPAVLERLLAGNRNPVASRGDFHSQVSANRRGVARLYAELGPLGADGFASAVAALNDYAHAQARAGLADLPAGRYEFEDFLDDDGAGTTDIPIRVSVDVDDTGVRVDFTGTSPQVRGNVNCPLPVAAAAVYYVFFCLMPAATPACAGSLRPIRLHAPRGCLVNAERPAAVAAGNVETSTRIVDAILGALAPALPARIPAASHGSMNNMALGAPDWDYYETMGGGMGAGAAQRGLDAVQTHMTNTLNTPIEIMEMHYPMRVRRYAIRRFSGGDGRHRGGDGLVREIELLAPATITLLTDRRRRRPWGLHGGAPGMSGRALLDGLELPPKVSIRARAGARLCIESGGGGGWGSREPG
ncbi:MAG: hydantoinase B/oxoprolinase family protein [Gammaproteobacteria bacterium]|nr:hydantoinase B/oxoprolinase family protein [Gammaproteobacteria bacterium]